MTAAGDFGIDYAWHAALDPHALLQGGVRFVARYYARAADSKRLNLNEAKVLSAAGIDLVTVWETTANRANEGASAGAADGAAAVAQARDCGQPRGSGIYWAVDFDTTVGPLITAYATEFGKACHAASYRHGVYGSYTIVEQCLSRGLCDLGWQTYAWSGGRVSQRAHLLQYSNGHYVRGLGGECDYDRALKNDFGQWRVGGYQPPPPPPPGELGKLPLAVDGDFGRQTIGATQRVDRSVVDGDWGPNSKRDMQRHLGVGVDGDIGPITVRALQRRVGAVVDGDWGPNTTRALQNALNGRRY